MKSARTHPDYVLLFIVGVLLLLGIVIITSVSASVLPEDPTFYLLRHLRQGVLLGLLLGFVAFKIPLSFFKKYSLAILLFSLFLTLLVFFPLIGLKLGGANRWLNLGLFTFQPSELLKLTFIIYLAAWLAARRAKTEDIKGFSQWSANKLVAFLVIMGIIFILLTLQPDVSTLVIIITCAFLMYFSAGTPIKHSLLIIGLGIISLAVLIKISPYRFGRILVFLNPEVDPMGLGYQIKQAIMTVGSGGIFGMGLGMGIQRFLPQPLSDSLFALFAEQAGFIGSTAIIILFLLLFWRGYVIAKKSQDTFCKLTALGISFWIVLQAFVHIGVAMGMLPVTGIPLPFISYGGTATVVSLIGIGILLNISKNERQPQKI